MRRMIAALVTLATALTLAATATTAVGAPVPEAAPRPAAQPSSGTVPDGVFLSAKNGGNTVASTIREARPRADGIRHVDTPAMINRLRQLNATMFTYDIWELKTDWDDLVKEFAPAAERAGIDIMVYIVPPTECFLADKPHVAGRCSRPFEKDYVAWASAIAELSIKHPNVKSWGIDDFLVGPANTDLFTPEYLASVNAAQDAINPELKWYVSMYHGDVTPENMAKIKGSTDGVIYIYNAVASTIDPTLFETNVDHALAVTGAAGQELVLLTYMGRFLDGIIHPDARYATEIMKRAEPYLADGRLVGVIAYGTPLDATSQQPGWDYHAYTGSGSLSLSVSNFVTTTPGSFAAATQRVRVDPGDGNKTITFRQSDPQEGGDGGYQFKQLLIDDQVVWSEDIVLDQHDAWFEETIDVTAALQGKQEADLTFRLYHELGIGWSPNDLRIDDVRARGLKITNGGFEKTTDWQLTRSGPQMQPYIDLFRPSRPAEIFNAIGAAYGRYRGVDHRPIKEPKFPGLVVSPDNRAMTGNGRLEFAVGRDVTVPANTCASASQQVRVQQSLPRYEIDFWHADPYQAKFDKYFKQVLIDGVNIWNRDLGDYWNWFYMQGSDHQGPIDITEFVKGKRSVTIEYRLCTVKEVVGLDVSYNVDNIKTIGLDLDNGGFEHRRGWVLRAPTANAPGAGPAAGPNSPIKVAIRIAQRK